LAQDISSNGCFAKIQYSIPGNYFARELFLAMRCRARHVAFVVALVVGTAQSFAPHPHAAAAATRSAALRRSGLIVAGRKGRPKMPQGGMQGAYAKGAQQAPPEAPADGSSIFYLYARTGPGKPWYPVSAMKGDGQSKGLINAWLGSPWAKGFFKDRLDSGLAASIFDSERRLAEMAVSQYSLLRDYKSRLQWGFKILDKDVNAKEAAGEIEKQNIVPVNRGMIQKGPLEAAQNVVTNVFGGGGDGGEGGIKNPLENIKNSLENGKNPLENVKNPLENVKNPLKNFKNPLENFKNPLDGGDK